MPLTLDRIAELYQEHAHTYYRRANGKPTRTAENIRDACRSFCSARWRWGQATVRAGAIRADQMSPQVLRKAQQAMAQSGKLSRGTVNDRIKWVRAMFRWAALEGLCDDLLPHRLQIVPALKRGRTKAHETDPVKPVSWETVSATLAHAPLQLSVMIETQWLTAMRPGELVQMAWPMIDTTADPWLYRPNEHKTEHHGKHRIIPIGPQAQALLRQWKPRCKGKALWPMQRLSYYRAIQRINKAHGIPPWHPNQIRHAAATRLRKELGLEAARVVLGHSTLRMADHYAEADVAAAIRAMRDFG